MHIDYNDETDLVDQAYIELMDDLLQYAAKKQGVADDAEMSVNFVHNDAIQELNRTYRQKDSPTDVISFAMQEKLDEEPDVIGVNLPVMLGDIVISIDKAKEQAKEYNHSFKRELAFLTVHGFLHLLGFDHMSEEDEKVMFGLQEEILGEFGIER